nr:MAG TPA: hypothetical protein [Caudoviricetes sp.]
MPSTVYVIFGLRVSFISASITPLLYRILVTSVKLTLSRSSLS